MRSYKKRQIPTDRKSSVHPTIDAFQEVETVRREVFVDRRDRRSSNVRHVKDQEEKYEWTHVSSMFFLDANKNSL